MMRAGLKNGMLAVAVLLAAAANAAELTYPKCADGGSGCCTFGSGLMKSPGYAVIRMDVDTIVTCSHGELQCFEGNPNLRAGLEGRDSIECPGSCALYLMCERLHEAVIDDVCVSFFRCEQISLRWRKGDRRLSTWTA